MDLQPCIEKIKRHPDFDKAGMILAHNGVVRGTSRDGRKVSGLTVSVDHQQLDRVIESGRKSPGIIDIVIEINENKRLSVGDDVMLLVVAGDVREHVIGTLEKTLNAVKQTVTRKTEYFID